MSVANHRRAYRPVRGGILIFCPGSGEAGTLGMVLTSDGVDRWLLTCRHVIARSNHALLAADRVLQPDVASGAIGTLENVVSDLTHDCAAVKLAVAASSEVLGIGALGPCIAPAVGMRVVKSGWRTGVSEGMIQQISGDSVTIAIPPGYPADYLMATAGDSGAVWLEMRSRAPVALHTRESAVGLHTAIGTTLTAVLNTLRLRQA